MIRAFCDICEKEADDPRFFCELHLLQEHPALEGLDVSKQMTPQKVALHICKKCYNSKFKEIIYGKK